MKVVKREDLREFLIVEGVSGEMVFSSDKVMFLLVEIAPR